jgi:hypothetical protein
MKYDYFGKMNSVSFLNTLRFKIDKAIEEERERKKQELIRKAMR